MKNLPNQIETLFQNRYHGAVNIRGIKFQLLYSILCSFDLYSNPLVDEIILEGIEDIDVKGFQTSEIKLLQISNQYIQIKSSGSNWNLSNLRQKRVIENFLEVWKLEPTSNFQVITNFGYQDKLDELVKYCSGVKTKISQKLEQDLEKIFQAESLSKRDVIPFLQRLHFQRISEEEIISQIEAKIVKHYELETRNSELYFLTLVSRFLDWSVSRKEISRQQLEEVKHFVQDQINLGTVNPAIQNGWLEKLIFASEASADDYYEGTNARPGHIWAGFDVVRTNWLDEIKKILEETGVCVIRTSSGQGKSSLLYRYAFQNYQAETTFIVKNLNEETMVGSLKQAILAKKTLGLPILVLIDNVSSNLKYWHQLVSELVGNKIDFIITIREEDWFRYSGGVAGFKWGILTPELTLDEARRIFAEFQKQGKIAEGIISAEQSFEKVAERKLLLEFTYLITHGQMLSERLWEQIKKMQEMGEDKAKLHILRLISVAQIYQSKIKTESLLNRISFSSDPGLTLESLRKEYLLFTENGCEGLHLVRSQHLADILHQVIPIESTICELIQILDAENLASFVSYVFSDTKLNQQTILQTLVERGNQEELKTVIQITEALFTANERNYFYQNRHLFDEGKELGGGVFFLSSATMPFIKYDVLANFGEIFNDNEEFKKPFELLSKIRDRFTPRDWTNRTDTIFLQQILKKSSDESFLDNLRNLGEFFNWCRLVEVADVRIKQILSKLDWAKAPASLSVTEFADLLFVLFHFLPDYYDKIHKMYKTKIQGLFKKQTDTLVLEEQDNGVFIEFIVEQRENDQEKPNKQAENRLFTLFKLFPIYETYKSQGLYTTDFGVGLPVDDTKKNFTLDVCKLGDGADKNSIYQKIVENYYAVQSIYDWQKVWYEFRRDVSRCFRDTIEASQAASVGKSNDPEIIDKQFANLILCCQKQYQFQLPDALGSRVRQSQQDINSWFTSVQNFFNQYLQNTEESRRLSLINLRDAGSKLFKAQDAFQTISTETQNYFDFAELDQGEIEKYFYLADVFEVLYGDKKDFPIRNLKTYLETKKRKQINSVKESLRESFATLEKEGFSFIYPTKLLVKSDDIGSVETSVCIGFEIIDFTKILEQIEIIIRSVPNFTEFFWNLYMIPLIKGKIYTNSIWRISFSNITQINAGEGVGAWALLPQPIEREILSTLIPLKEIEIPEIIAIANFKAVCAEFHVIRKTRSLLMDKLNGELESDKYLSNLYQDRLQLQTNKALENSEQVLADLENLIGVVQSEKLSFEEESAWAELIQVCLDKYKEATENLNEDLSEYENKLFWFDREIDNYLGNYLNIKFGKNNLYDS